MAPAILFIQLAIIVWCERFYMMLGKNDTSKTIAALVIMTQYK